MARIAGVNIPTGKRVHVALTYIHGLGVPTAKKIVDDLGIPQSTRINDLSDDQILALRETIDRDYIVEGDLRRGVAMNIKRLQDMKSLRGMRHRAKLPVRGQRTRCNARTRKGKAVAIAGKKK